MREIGQFPLWTWGAVYPRHGLVHQSDDAKAGGGDRAAGRRHRDPRKSAARLSAPGLGSRVVPELIGSDSDGRWGRGCTFSQTRVWDPGRLIERDHTTGEWQMLAPRMESSCGVFGTNDLTSLNSWGVGQIAEDRNYAWVCGGRTGAARAGDRFSSRFRPCPSHEPRCPQGPAMIDRIRPAGPCWPGARRSAAGRRRQLALVAGQLVAVLRDRWRQRLHAGPEPDPDVGDHRCRCRAGSRLQLRRLRSGDERHQPAQSACATASMRCRTRWSPPPTPRSRPCRPTSCSAPTRGSTTCSRTRCCGRRRPFARHQDLRADGGRDRPRPRPLARVGGAVEGAQLAPRDGDGRHSGDGDIVATKEHIERQPLAARGALAGRRPPGRRRPGADPRGRRRDPGRIQRHRAAPPRGRHGVRRGRPQRTPDGAALDLARGGRGLGGAGARRRKIATCFERYDCPARRSTPGMGLTRLVEAEREALLPELVDLIGGATPLTAVTWPGSPPGGERHARPRAGHPGDAARGAGMAIGRLADEIAVGVNVERALYLRRFLLDGPPGPRDQCGGAGAGP
jgi:hypothetical protein